MMTGKRWIIEDDEPLQIIDSKGEYGAVCVLYSEDAHQIRDLLNEKEERIEYLEHQLHSLNGLWASDKEDMSYPFRLEFKELKMND